MVIYFLHVISTPTTQKNTQQNFCWFFKANTLKAKWWQFIPGMMIKFILCIPTMCKQMVLKHKVYFSALMIVDPIKPFAQRLHFGGLNGVVRNHIFVPVQINYVGAAAQGISAAH